MTGALTSAYESTYRRSIEDPEGFWGELGERIAWEKKWDRVLDAGDAPLYRWFVGGALNTCFNAVDRHVQQGQGGASSGLGHAARLCWRRWSLRSCARR